MNSSFSCFYNLTESTELEKIWKDKQTIFIFDTNVLLSLYSFQPESRKDFLKVLSSINDRIWIPFHVGLEFQKNRLTIIKNRRNTFDDLNKGIDNLTNSLTFDRKPFTSLQSAFSLKKNYPSVYSKLNENLEKVNTSFNKLEEDIKHYLKEIKDEVVNLDKDKIFVNSHDYIRDEIDQLFRENNLGINTFDTKEKLEALYKEGNIRYQNKIPPGYADESKGEEEFYFDGLGYKRKFGDLIIFKQIIEFCKEKSIKNIIFVSEDIKDDWRLIQEQGGKKILGARPELKRELYKEAGVENFFIYQIEEFMKKTNDYLGIKIEIDTLKSIKLSLEEDKHQRNIEEIKERKIVFDSASNVFKVYAKMNKEFDEKSRAIEKVKNNYKSYVDKVRVGKDMNEVIIEYEKNKKALEEAQDPYKSYVDKVRIGEDIKEFIIEYEKNKKALEEAQDPYKIYKKRIKESKEWFNPDSDDEDSSED